MKTQKINLFNVGFSGFSATEADLRDGTVGHVNYALSQIDLGTGADTELNARGRVLFNPISGFGASGYGPGSTLNIGEKYIIDSFSEGDDFTNVGAAENAQGVVFTATGDTPAVWNGSNLIENGAKYIVDFFNNYGDQPTYKWAYVVDGQAGNKGLDYIGGPVDPAVENAVFAYNVVDETVVLENVEFFYGILNLIVADFKIYDSIFPSLKFDFIVDTKNNASYVILFDDTVDFRNYTVWSSPILGVYRSLNTGDIKSPIASTGRVTAISDAAYLSEFVDSEDGKIYIPVFEPKLGLRFDFEIRLYDYVAPAPVVEFDVEALEVELKRLTELLKEAENVEARDEMLILAYKQQYDDIKKLIENYRNPTDVVIKG